MYYITVLAVGKISSVLKTKSRILINFMKCTSTVNLSMKEVVVVMKIGERERAVYQIHGYLLPKRNQETLEQRFNKAKEETITAMKIELQHVQDISFEMFCKVKM